MEKKYTQREVEHLVRQGIYKGIIKGIDKPTSNQISKIVTQGYREVLEQYENSKIVVE